MDANREQLLALKVMRLTKPSFVPNQPLILDSLDEADPCLSLLTEANMNTLADSPYINLGEMLSLPQTFGNIFLGETFSSYISIHNDSQQTCHDIIIKADLQTGSQRLQLSSTSDKPIKELAPEQSIDDVIHHEVKELGTHILVCSVNYANPNNEKLYFRKFFKFQVLKPLDVKTKFYNAETDEVYLEAQIQNTTPGPIFLERVILEPTINYKVVELNSKGDSENGTSIHGWVNCLKPTEIRQYLYSLLPRSDQVLNNQVGKLDITWRSQMGERGRLQTSPLNRMGPGYGDLRVVVTYLPSEVSIEQPFGLTCKVTNCSDRNMNLILGLKNLSQCGMMWTGISGRQLGDLSPSNSITLNLALIPILTGLQAISGLRLTDTLMKRVYEHDDIGQVLVLSS